MTFNPMMGKAVMKCRQFIEGNELSVIELGSQTLTFRLKDREFKDVPDYYDFLGFTQYESIDFDGKGTQTGDLNYPKHVGTPYDLVTNNGTGEHIFNQAAIFETCHNVCKPNGVMLHVLPWINWRNHGFYNFNPVLFYDLAHANDYEILFMYAGDRDGNVSYENIDAKEIKRPDATDKNHMLVVALRKKGSAAFKFPVQGKYRHHVDGQSPQAGDQVSASNMGGKPAAQVRHQPAVRVKSVIASLKTRRDHVQPFPYFVGRLDEAYTEKLIENFPAPDDVVLGREIVSNKLYQRSAGEILGDDTVSPFWRSFFELHTSESFLNEIFLIFAPEIRRLYPQIARLPLKPGVRFRDKAPFQLDCQFAVNSPVAETGSVRGPHLDDPKELYAGLVYMGGGELDIYRWKAERKFIGRAGMKKRAECDPDFVEKIETIECLPGTVVFFLNTPDSIHGVGVRQRGEGWRRYINIIGELEAPLFELK